MFNIFNKDKNKMIRAKAGKVLEFEDINLEVYIRNCINLKEGDIFESDVLEITKLDFKGWPLISIRGIESVINLEELILYQSKMNNLSFLKKLTKMKKLDLSWSDSISEIDSLINLKELEELSISYSSGLKNFYVINEFKKLKKLDLSENYLYDISFMKDISWIGEINLSKNNLSEYKSPDGNLGIKILDISANRFEKIEFLEKMPNLEILDISVNRIADISVLMKLDNLKHVDLRGNKIDFSTAENKETMRKLKKIKCKIKK